MSGPGKSERERVEESIERDAKRIDRAKREHRTVLAEMSYFGAVGLVFVLPVVGGTYLGDWLDGRSGGYSVHWTIGLMLAGIVVGAVNVWLMIRD